MILAELRGARAGYRGTDVLSGVSLTVEAGQRIALVGESGAGKSTLLRMLHRAARVPAAMVPQDFGLVPALSVFHNVHMGRLDRHGWTTNLRTLLWPRPAEIEAVRRVLEPLRLAEQMFAAAGELSGGQQQRAAIGRALHQEAPLILADEPVSAVDEHQALEILGVLCRGGAAVVLAMHDRALALAHADRVIGLRGGAIAFDRAAAGLTPADLDALYPGAG